MGAFFEIAIGEALFFAVAVGLNLAGLADEFVERISQSRADGLVLA
jgi:hypothetical protein